MKQLAIVTIAALSIASAFAQPAKTPIAATPAPVASAPAPVASAPKTEMKLAKKKEDKKVDATKSAPKAEAAPATTAPKADAKPAAK